MKNILTLISDFGSRDGYIGAIKGMVRTAAPDVDLVEISNEITPFHIGQGAFCLYNSHSWFPQNTVHVAIVDPGVGSDRDILFLKANQQVFIGPDNGLFDPIVYLYEDYECCKIDIRHFGDISPTFHGRDVFIPAALKFLKGENVSEFCTPSEYSFKILTPEMMAGNSAVVLNTDHFGNIITAVNKVKIAGRSIDYVQFDNIKIPFVQYYDEAGSDKPVCLFGSHGLLEVAIDRDSAEQFFRKRWDGLPSEFEIIWKD